MPSLPFPRPPGKVGRSVPERGALRPVWRWGSGGLAQHRAQGSPGSDPGCCLQGHPSKCHATPEPDSVAFPGLWLPLLATPAGSSPAPVVTGRDPGKLITLWPFLAHPWPGSLLSPEPWGQPHRVALGGQLAGLAVRGTDAKLVQPGTQQVEPVPETAPPRGGQAWQSFPAQGTQPVPTWLPTFPRCHPPLSPPPRSAPGQCPQLLVQGRDAISPSPLGAQALGAPRYEQPRSPRKSKHGMRATRTPKCPHLLSGLWSWDTQTSWLPTAAPPPHCPQALGQNSSLWCQRQYGDAPSSCLRLPGGAAKLGDCWLSPLLLELLLCAPHSWTPWSSTPTTPPQAGSPSWQASPYI
uniref:Uncharacterized protein n=1 Tax=Molossus molossus TaxID=27622 RepID=A0A7J8ERJ3_MOLMO|nr:hypothetical protein HJG59_008648 [Molossus molossus]